MSDTFHDYFPSRSKEDAYREFLGYPGKALGQYLGDGDSVQKALAGAEPSGIDTHTAYTRTDPRTGKLEQIKGNRTAAPKTAKAKSVFGTGEGFARAVALEGIVDDPKDEAELAACVSAVFGKKVPLFQDFMAGYAPPEGFTATIHNIDLTPWISADHTPAFYVNFEIHNADDDGVGSMLRRYERRGGKLIVTHESFDIVKTDPATRQPLQGNPKIRFGETVTRNAFRFYRKIGVHSVETLADGAEGVGRYAWATFGFDWFDGDAKKKVLTRLNTYLTKGLKLTGDQTKKIMESMHHPWDVAALHVNNQHVGKIFMQKFGPDWDGAVKLKDGEPSWERLKERVKGLEDA